MMMVLQSEVTHEWIWLQMNTHEWIWLQMQKENKSNISVYWEKKNDYRGNSQFSMN